VTFSKIIIELYCLWWFIAGRDGSSGGAAGAQAPPTASEPIEPPWAPPKKFHHCSFEKEGLHALEICLEVEEATFVSRSRLGPARDILDCLTHSCGLYYDPWRPNVLPHSSIWPFLSSGCHPLRSRVVASTASMMPARHAWSRRQAEDMRDCLLCLLS
jgi:hypothetical protein